LKVLFDTNVVLDVMLAREPFAAESNACFMQAEEGLLTGFLGATTVTTLDYLMSPSLGALASRAQIAELLTLFEIAAVNQKVLRAAAASGVKDFEDAMLAEAAHASGVSAIITRNARDFVGWGLAVYTPREWLASAAQ
jgi:predicted nucleic acid-binding protein